MVKWMLKKTKAGIDYGKPKITGAAKLGAKYAVKGGVKGIRAGATVAKESYRLAAFGVQQKLVESLLRLCYQADRAKRIAARAASKASSSSWLRDSGSDRGGRTPSAGCRTSHALACCFIRTAIFNE